jgi:hypothetical protein
MPVAIPDPPHLHNGPHMVLQITNACTVLEGKMSKRGTNVATWAQLWGEYYMDIEGNSSGFY